MPICEVLPRRRIGPVEIGRKLGPPLKDPTDSIVLRRWDTPSFGQRHEEEVIIANVLQPDKVVISSCRGTKHFPLITISGAAINKHFLTERRLRWVPEWDHPYRRLI